MQSYSILSQSHPKTINYLPKDNKPKSCNPTRLYNPSIIEQMSEYFVDRFLCGAYQHKVLSQETDTFQLPIERLNITKKHLKSLPPFYPLERTFKVIKNTSAGILSERLIKCIKIHGLATKWNGKNPSSLYCSTNSFLKFEINLWKQESSPAERQNGDSCNIIVEIRRHEGCCVSFHRLRAALFTVLCQTNNSTNSERYRDDRSSNETGMAISNMHLRPLALDNLMDVLNSVTMAYELIQNQNPIDMQTGFQMLLFLTDAKSIHRVYAAHVSDFLLLGHDVFSNDIPAVKEAMHKYVIEKRNCVEHHYALQILTNAFEHSSLQQDIPVNVQPDLDTWNEIIPSLMLDMKNVEKNPHVAYNAVKCLRAWFGLAGDQADMKYKKQILSSLKKVRSFGQQWYSSIEEECNNLTMALEIQVPY